MQHYTKYRDLSLKYVCWKTVGPLTHFPLTASILIRTSQEENIFSISCFHQTLDRSRAILPSDLCWRQRNPHRGSESGLRLVSGPGSRPPLNTWLRLRHRLRHTSDVTRAVHYDNILRLGPAVTHCLNYPMQD